MSLSGYITDLMPQYFSDLRNEVSLKLEAKGIGKTELEITSNLVYLRLIGQDESLSIIYSENLTIVYHHQTFP